MPGLHDQPMLFDAYRQMRLAHEAEQECFDDMHEFMRQETLGLPLDGDDAEQNSQIAIDNMAIAAETLAGTIALSQGVYPVYPDFTSEAIVESLNKPENEGSQWHIIDIDRDPEWADKLQVDEELVRALMFRAQGIAQALVSKAANTGSVT